MNEMFPIVNPTPQTGIDTKHSEATNIWDLSLDTTLNNMEQFTLMDLIDPTWINEEANSTLSNTQGKRSLSSYEYIILISTPVIVILGTVGNGLSGMVMLRQRFRNQSTSAYLVALAISDTTFLYSNSMTKNFIKVLFHVNYSTVYQYSCATYVYVLLVSKCLSAWLIVAVTTERLVVVCNPLTGKMIATRKRAYIAIGCITFIILAIYSFVLPSFESQLEDSGKIGCEMKISHKKRKIDVILKFFDMVVYSVLPSIILFTCNILLVFKVVKSNKFRRRSTRKQFSTRKTFDQSKRLTMMLLLLSCVYLILTFPMTAFLCYAAIVENVKNYQLVFRSLYTLQLTNSAMNFVLYTSGPAFRQELIKVFCWRRKPEKPRRLSFVSVSRGQNELPSPSSAISVC